MACGAGTVMGACPAPVHTHVCPFGACDAHRATHKRVPLRCADAVSHASFAVLSLAAARSHAAARARRAALRCRALHTGAHNTPSHTHTRAPFRLLAHSRISVHSPPVQPFNSRP
jgi:hypothetical protein